MNGTQVGVFKVDQHVASPNLGVFVNLVHVVDRPSYDSCFFQHLEPIGSGVGYESLFQQRSKLVLAGLAVTRQLESQIFDQVLGPDGAAQLFPGRLDRRANVQVAVCRA